MLRPIILMSLILSSAAFATDIVFSRDSLRAFNAKTSNRSDTLIITNNGSQQVFIESLMVHFDVLDTTGPFDSAVDQRFEVVLLEIGNGTSIAHNDLMKSLGNHSFSIRFTAESRPPFPIVPGGTTRLTSLVFGNFSTSATGKYPKYLQGTMYFFFSSGCMDSLHIYSDDLRTIINTVKTSGRFPVSGNCSRVSSRFLINGRMLTEQHTLPGARRTVPMFRAYNFPHAR